MIIDTDVEKSYTNVATGTPISVDMPLDTADELRVYYGSTRILAVLNVDYTITLNDVDFSDFVFTPLASLLTKIAAELAGNVVYLNRLLPLTSDLSENDSYFRQKLVKAIDRMMMRFQQVMFPLRTGATHNITVTTDDVPDDSLGEDGDIWLKV